jgi:hypothetical protein
MALVVEHIYLCLSPRLDVSACIFLDLFQNLTVLFFSGKRRARQQRDAHKDRVCMDLIIRVNAQYI